MDPSILYTAAGGLVSGIVFLFRLVMRKSDEQVELTRRVGKLEGRHEGIETLAHQTLGVVRDVAERAHAKPPAEDVDATTDE